MNNPNIYRYLKYIFIISSGFLVFSLGFITGKMDFVSDVDLSSIQSQQYLYGDMSGSNVGVNVDVMWEAWDNLEKYYIDPSKLDKNDLLYGAVRGLVRSIGDPFTQYLSPDETADYKDTAGGQFEGIGALLRFDGDYTIIDTPIDGFPAQKTGLMAGDVIINVDEKDVAGKSSYEVAELIKGPAGTEVKIEVFRPRDEEEMEFIITRASIDIDNIKLIEMKDGVAQIKIYRFNEENAQEFKNQWVNIVDKVNADNVDKIILDLRNNPGGRVDLVQYIAEEFLDNGQLIMIEEEHDGSRKEYRATRKGKFSDKKVIILLNSGSASASEILAGALKDNNRVTLIGMPTLGKGVEQTVINLSDGATMHIVFRRWLTPSGKQVTFEEPIQPDIEVDLSTEDFQEGRDPQLDKAWEEIF